MKTILVSLVFFVSLILFNGCRKCSNTTDPLPETIKAEGTIVDSGQEAANGCGWILNIHNQSYKPVNLSSSFMVNGKSVQVEYVLQGTEYRYGLAGTPMKYIEIKSIQ